MKKFILLLFHIGITHFLFGQAMRLSSLVKVDFGLQGVGFSYEPGLANKLTMDVSAGAGGAYDVAESYFNYKLDLRKAALYFSLTPKYFYNRDARSLKGKSTLLNAGNYVGMRLKYVTPTDGQADLTRNTVLINLHWGIQRVIGNNWAINALAGIGYAQDIDYNFGTVYPAIDLKFSYVFPKKTPR